MFGRERKDRVGIRFSICFLLIAVFAACSNSYQYQFEDVDTERTPEREANIHDGIRQLDAYISGQVQRRVTPGAAVSVVYDDEVLYQQAYNQSIHRPYAVLSFTKTFTALAVLQLVEAGKLRLEDRADHVLGAQLEMDRFAH